MNPNFNIGLKSRPEKKAIILEVIVVLGVLFVPSFVQQILVANTGLSMFLGTDQLLTRFVIDCTHVLLIAYVAFGVRQAIPISKLGFDVKWDIPLGVLLFCCGRVLWLGICPLLTGKGAPLAIPIHQWDSPLWTLGLMAATVALSAFYQELLMRWYLISRLEQVGLRTWGSILASTTLFAAWHIYEGKAGVVHAFCAGILYSACFVWTRRLGPIVIGHFLWNFVAFLQVGHA